MKKARKNVVWLCCVIICALSLVNAYGGTMLENYLSNGTEALENGQLDYAVQNFSKAIDLDRQSAAAYNGLASAYQRQNKVKLAITNFTKAIELNPSYEEAYLGRGICYLKPDDYDKAIADLSEAIKLNKNNADAYYYRGQAYLFTGEHKKSMEDIQTAERLGKEVDPKILESLKAALK